ncbi:MAG TPA: hypothetical protein VFQ42_22270 [Mycobacterium sp.]|nr:hypothetical protein [Mycobacterium sp.]
MSTPFNTTTGSASITGTKFSLMTSSTTLTAQTTAGAVEVLIDDKTNMVAGDQYLVELTEKVNGGTARPLWTGYMTGVQTGIFRIPRIDVNEGWSVNMQLITGSARTIGWSVKQHVGDVNALTAGSGAVTSIQSGLATSTAVSSIQADTDDIQTRLPAALDGSGFMKAGVQSIVAGAITAASIASSAITAAKFATDAVDANALAASAVAEIQSGLATSSSIASIQADTDDIQARLPTALDGSGNMKAAVQSIVTGAVTASSIAASAITSAKFATDAIDSNALAASAVAEIQTGLATSSSLSSVSTQVAGVQADTDDIQTRLPASLDGSGFIKASVQSLVSGAITSIATGVLAGVVETGFTVQSVLQIVGAAAGGVLTGLSTSNPVFKSLNGLKNRITGTTSADGRPTVTYDNS